MQLRLQQAEQDDELGGGTTQKATDKEAELQAALTWAGLDAEAELPWTLAHPYTLTAKDVNPERTAASLTGDPRNGPFLADFNSGLIPGLTGLSWRPGLTIYRPRVIPPELAKRSRLNHYVMEKREQERRAKRKRDRAIEEARISKFIGSEPLITRVLPPLFPGAPPRNLDSYVLSDGAKKFLTALFNKIYGFQFPYNDLTITMVDTLSRKAVGRHIRGSIKIVRSWWESHNDDRTVQLQFIAHELFHEYQDRLREKTIDPPKRNLEAERKKAENYVLTQDLVDTAVDRMSLLSLDHTEDQLAQRVMYEIAILTGDVHEYTDNFQIEKTFDFDKNPVP